MSTLSRDMQPKKSTLFRANPVLSRLSKVNERAAGSAATYSGIALKTCYFLLLALTVVITYKDIVRLLQ